MGKRERDKEWDTYSVRTLIREAKAYKRAHKGQSLPDVELPPLPTRDECRNGVRPCPHVRCRYNLLVEVGDLGTVRVYWDDDKIHESCSLDVAERGAQGPGEVAAIMRLTKQRINQIEHEALAQLKEALERRGLEEAHVQEALARIELSQHRTSSAFGDPVDAPEQTKKMALAANACLEEMDRKAGRKIDSNPFTRYRRQTKPDA